MTNRTIFRFALKRSFRSKLTMVTLWLIPIVILAMTPFWTSQDKMGFAFYGMIVMFAAFLLVRSIMSDRATKTIVRILAAPVTTFQYLLQNLLAYLLILIVQVFLMVSLGSILYKWSLVFAAQLLLCYTIFAGTSIAFSLAWNSLFKSKQTSDAVFSVVVSLMGILGGIFVPINLLPDLLQKIGMLLPTYWLANALYVLGNGNQMVDYWLSIGILFLFTIAFLIFGSKRRLE